MKALKTLLALAIATFSVLVVVQSFADEGQQKDTKAAKHHIQKAADIHWTDAGSLLPEGAQLSLIDGDLADENVSVFRLKFPANYEVPAHFHPSNEHVTVLSGALNFGTGEKLDKEKTTRLTSGSYFRVDAEYPHYAWTDQEVVLELVSDGVFGITYVNPEDDPRLQKAVGGGADAPEAEDAETQSE